jgi:hypothetical protein
VRLFPFVFADDDAVIIAAGHAQFAVYRWNATLGYAEKLTITVSTTITDGAWPHYNDPTPPAHPDLSQLRASQVGDVVVFTHPDRQPVELRRLSSDSTQWSTAWRTATAWSWRSRVSTTAWTPRTR